MKICKDREKIEREDSENSASIERGEVVLRALRLEQDAANQETGQNEEQINS